MHPILENGSIVVVNHTQKNPKALDGKMAAFRQDGGVTRKRLKPGAEDLIMAFPENRQSKEPYSFRGEEIDWALIGKIEWWWGRRK